MEPTYRAYCVDYITEYVTAAELAWPGNGTEYPHSMSGADHLSQHLAHDLNLSERDEVTFRFWWAKNMDHGFDNDRKAA
jgi:hypothetical protein